MAHSEQEQITKIEKEIRRLRKNKDFLEKLESLAALYLTTDSYLPALDLLTAILAKESSLSLTREDILALRLKKAECHLRRGELAKASAEEQLVHSLLALDDCNAMKGRAALLSSRIQWESGSYETAFSEAGKALSLLKDGGTLPELAQCHMNLGRSLFRLGDYSQAREHYESALAFYRLAGDEVGVGMAHNNCGLILKNICDWTGARRHLELAVEIARKLGSYGDEAVRNLNLGLLEFRMGVWDKAESHVRVSLDSFIKIGDRVGETNARLALGNFLRARRMWDESREILTQAYEVAEKYGLRRQLALADEFMGELLYDTGEIEDALHHYAAALEIAESIAPSGDMVPEIERRRGEALISMGDYSGSRTAFGNALRLAAESGDRIEEICSRRGLAELLMNEGMTAESTRELLAAIKTLEEIGEKFELAKTYFLLARLSPRPSSEEETRKRKGYFLRASLLFDELGLSHQAGTSNREIEQIESAGPVLHKGKMGAGAGSVPKTPSSGWGIVTRDKRTLDALSCVEAIRDSSLGVLIQGETGTGKNLFAYIFAEHEKVKGRPFVEVNCATLPAELMESELFGYAKGAFSGASAEKKGIIEEANGGTIFFNEVAELSDRMQAKLLQVLDDGTYRRLGETGLKKVSVRVISATNKDILGEVESGRFRRDLYHRLSQLSLELPPLRERKGDVPYLVQHFLAGFEKRYGKKIRISDEAVGLLDAYSWPGNVRELRNELEVAYLTAEDSSVLGPDSFSHRIVAGNPVAEFQPGQIQAGLEKVKRTYVEATLKRYRWNKARAAKALGVSPWGLRKMMARYGLHSTREN
ncbi:MAG: sigma 54-interacting transcriptional regulator [Candidatus Eisenbacteria bacterium]|nr:sigma 54-interacting transcriptional regulator [Candidatus Eisenbacteria bacterium]